MKRTSWIVISITAAVMVMAPAASAASSSGYQSITAILGSDGNPAPPAAQERDYTSVAAVLGAPPSARSNDGGERDFTSISALVGGKDEPRTASPVEKSGYRSISSIVGPVELTPEQETAIARDSGFDWGDALVGAAVALGLVVISLVAMLILRRRRVFAESRV
jgi:hypothetical protein